MDETGFPSLPADEAGDSCEALFAAHRGPPPAIHRLILAAVAVALACLPLVDVDVVVTAAGIVRPATGRTEVRAAISGHVARVNARDNDAVEAGTALVELDATEIDARLAHCRDRQQARATTIGDLETLVATRAEAPEFPLRESSAALRSPALASEAAELAAQLEAARLDQDKARTELERYATLAARGIASRSELDRARYEVERLEASERLLRRQALARWEARRHDEEMAEEDLVAEETGLLAERAHHFIRAPVRGTLVGFVGWSPGTFVGAAQSLGAVSPAASCLVEAVIRPQDAGLVAKGQSAQLAVDAFPYTRWGTVPATVVTVADDAIAGAGGPAAFKIEVQPRTTRLTLPDGRHVELRKGLTVQVRLLVARRSLLELLMENAADWFDPRAARKAAPA